MDATTERRARGVAGGLLGLLAALGCLAGDARAARPATGRGAMAELELSREATQTVIPHGIAAFALRIRNSGTEPLPFSETLLSGAYAGAQLWLEVAITENAAAPAERFTPDPIRNAADDAVVSFLGVGDQREMTLDVGAKRHASGRPGIVAAFPSPGKYSVVACYDWRGVRSTSNAIVVEVRPVPEVCRAAQEQVSRLGDNQGYWLYEPQMIPLAMSHEDLPGLVGLAEYDCDHGQYARFALGWHFTEQAHSAKSDAMAFGGAKALAERYLEGISRDDLPFQGKLLALRKSLPLAR
jgi:hypothetical protein